MIAGTLRGLSAAYVSLASSERPLSLPEPPETNLYQTAGPTRMPWASQSSYTTESRIRRRDMPIAVIHLPAMPWLLIIHR